MMKRIYIFLTLLTMLFIPFTSRFVRAESGLKDEVYECKGTYKTMLLELPMDLRVEKNSLTWKLWFQRKENYQFDVRYPNGVLIKRIDSRKISVQQFGTEGTLLLDKCELLFSVENLWKDGLPLLRQFFIEN